MRREDYERSYGRRGHLHPPISPSHESSRSRRSRKSRRKMKCLISIGLILPALAAIIGVAAWAVSADVVMSHNGNQVNNKADNQLLQRMSENQQNNPRRDIFQNNQIDETPKPIHQNPVSERQQPEQTSPRTTTTSKPTSTTADVSAILSKLISASNAAAGNNGPRFVVVAPLPDHAKIVPKEEKDMISPISRIDNPPTSKFEDSWKPSRDEDSHDLMASSSHHQPVKLPPIFHPPTNITSRVGLPNNKIINHRRSNEQPSFVIDLSTNNQRRYNSHSSHVDMSGFEPFMSADSLLGSSMDEPPPPPQPPHVPGYVATGPFKNRSPPQGFINSQREPSYYPPKHPMFNEPPPSFVNSPSMQHPRGGYGLKPIQQQHGFHHHQDSPMVAEESRWGGVSFHPPPIPSIHIPKPPEGIALSISSPEKSHISAEPVSVIKSFFLPFLPRPKLNMNARVVFGVVLDKGMGLGGQKKDAGHLRPY